jgi:hypothetical protein
VVRLKNPSIGLINYEKQLRQKCFCDSKESIFGIAPAVAIIAVLLAKDKAPEVLLFLLGISASLIIGMNLRKNNQK